MPRYLVETKSKIKDHVAFHKIQSRDKAFASKFDKEPIILFKEK
jgi:hypothetical protein